MHEINIKTLAVEIDDYDEANRMESGNRNWGGGHFQTTCPDFPSSKFQRLLFFFFNLRWLSGHCHLLSLRK